MGDSTAEDAGGVGMATSMQQNVGILKAVVIGLGVLLVLGLAALVYGLMTRLGSRPAPPPSADARILLPDGAEIVETRLDQGRLILRLKTGTDQQIKFFDPSTGAEVGSLTVKTGPTK